MKLKALRSGWRRHLRHYSRLRRKLGGGQDPKVFCLSCSDSRVSVHEIFDLGEPGSIFEVKNVGGLFTDDARSALVYSLNHLSPDFVLVLHHTRCGGYHSLGEQGVEADIRKHMVANGGLTARLRVEAYLAEHDIQLSEDDMEQLIIEEGCRMQTESVISFLKISYPKQYDRVKEGEVKILPLLYDIVSGRVLVVPERLDAGSSMKRKQL